MRKIALACAAALLAACAHTEHASMELVSLIELFSESRGEPASSGDWTAGARPGSAIRWRTSGIQSAPESLRSAGYPYLREGEVVLTIGGAPTHEVLERTVVPGKWDIRLSGPRAGFTRVTVWSQSTGELKAVLEGLAKQLGARHYRCEPRFASSGNRVHSVDAPGRKPLWINEEWSCGSAGCSLSLDMVFTKNEADGFQCF
jgi:hypothetical protein